MPPTTPRLAGEVTLQRNAAGHWQLLRDGVPFAVKGVGGNHRPDLAATIGASTIRTWGTDQLETQVDGQPFADCAHACGLALVAGLWITHERQGMDYRDPAQVQAQRDRIRAEVQRYRDHPAIIAWGLGNEMEGPSSPTGHERIWREVEILAQIVKAEDPRRPVVTTIAGAARAKLEAVKAFCPSVDVIGLNLYGDAPLGPLQLDAAGWDRPFMLTEYGPPGPWEVVTTTWGAPIEPDTRAKIVHHLTSYRMALDDPRGRCVGTFAFLWGHKQEATATWFGMFLPSGEKTPLVDITAYAFTGCWPTRLSPRPEPLRPVFANHRVSPGAEYEVHLTVAHAEVDSLAYEWTVTSESTDRRTGGDVEAVPADHPECIIRQDGARATIRMPAQPGAYRLFVYVRDGHGGACSENIAFQVAP